MLDHDEALRRIAAGERAALAELFAAEAGRLKAVALRILRRDDLAEEAVQDAFVQIWRAAGQRDPARGTARGWIFTVLRNRALSILRARGREDLADADEIERLAEGEAAAGPVERLEETSRLRHCLQGLDETRRECVLMAYVAGYSHGEIAGRLGVPLGTAKTWVRRGLADLRACLS